MKPLNYLVLLLCIFQLAGCQQKEVPAELQEQLDNIAAGMVPQSAESIVDVDLVMSDGGVITAKGETDLPAARSAIIEMLEKSGVEYADSITVSCLIRLWWKSPGV